MDIRNLKLSPFKLLMDIRTKKVFELTVIIPGISKVSKGINLSADEKMMARLTLTMVPTWLS
jgi:hypothetical protein